MLKFFGKSQRQSSKSPDPFLRIQGPVRTQLIFFPPNLCLIWVSAYGEYNDLVREVAAARGQQLVNWDLEYVVLFPFP